MHCQTLLTFHANQKVKLPLVPQFPLYKASTKMWKCSHKMYLTSPPLFLMFFDKEWCFRCSFCADMECIVSFTSSAFIKWPQIASGLYLTFLSLLHTVNFDCGCIPLSDWQCAKHSFIIYIAQWQNHNDLYEDIDRNQD